jgi:hypothetical protein
MTVNGLKLPDAFVALIEQPELPIRWLAKGDPEAWIYKGGEGGLYWIPKGDADCDASLPDLELFKSLAEVELHTKRLPITMHVADYLPEEIAKGDALEAHLPGFLPFITDFSKIVHFGDSDTGAPYCFDYRENADEPGILHWNDAYWRRFAPHFDFFMSLFEPWVPPDER